MTMYYRHGEEVDGGAKTRPSLDHLRERINLQASGQPGAIVRWEIGGWFGQFGAFMVMGTRSAHTVALSMNMIIHVGAPHCAILRLCGLGLSFRGRTTDTLFVV